jgi:hypothetical protein
LLSTDSDPHAEDISGDDGDALLFNLRSFIFIALVNVERGVYDVITIKRKTPVFNPFLKSVDQ